MTVDMERPPVPVLSAGLCCRCPRCGEGRLFAHFVELAKACDHCGLDYRFADAGDGPAVFVIMVVGFLMVGAALAAEIVYEPPLWVHAVLWGPLALALALGVLRPLKALLIALQYKHKAEEGRLEAGGPGRPDLGS